jgi:hypothetical protein
MLAAGTVAVPAPADAADPPTRFGVIASTQGPTPDDAVTYQRLYEQQRDRYDGRIGIRLFSAGRLPLPGDGTMAGELLTWAFEKHPDELITVSHKTRDDARLAKLLDWALEHRVRLSVIYFHEVQDNWFRHRDARAKPAAYLSTYQSYRRIIHAHKAESLVTLEKNLMWYWQHYRSSESGGDWRAFVETDDPADVISWDTYVFPGMPTVQGRYAAPDEFFRYARDAWRRTGRPWAVGEIGSTMQDGVGPGAERSWDRDGAKFTRWVRTITTAASNPSVIDARYTGMPPALFVKWWAAPDRSGSDQSLDQAPAAVAAYRALVAQARL